MGLEKYGYKKEEIKVRKMTMAEMRLGIVQELLRKNYRYVNIRLVNITLGEVDNFKSEKDFLMAEFNVSYEIELTCVKEVDVYNEEKQITEKRIVIIIREIQ